MQNKLLTFFNTIAFLDIRHAVTNCFSWTTGVTTSFGSLKLTLFSQYKQQHIRLLHSQTTKLKIVFTHNRLHASFEHMLK